MERKISCIICAFNEASRIGEVLAAVSAHPDIDETIVVDDGSTDGTAAVIMSYPNVRLVRHPKNLGKSMAIVRGIREAKNELLFFLDADLIGVTAKNVSDLIRPVRSGSVDMTISLRKNSLLVYRLIGCDFVSGERVLSKKILEDHHDAITELPPFGFEVYVNQLVFDNDLRAEVVRWSNVVNPSKSSKMGFFSGIRSNIGMTKDIFKVITPLELLQQNYFLAGFR